MTHTNPKGERGIFGATEDPSLTLRVGIGRHLSELIPSGWKA